MHALGRRADVSRGTGQQRSSRSTACVPCPVRSVQTVSTGGRATLTESMGFQPPFHPEGGFKEQLQACVQGLLQHNDSAKPQHSVESTYTLVQARILRSPHLTIPAEAVHALFPHRTPATTLLNRCFWACSNTPERAAYKSLPVQLVLSVDGAVLQQPPASAELRVYPGRRAARVACHKAGSTLEGKVLTGWQCDSQGRLVALLKTRNKGHNAAAAVAAATTRLTSAQQQQQQPEEEAHHNLHHSQGGPAQQLGHPAPEAHMQGHHQQTAPLTISYLQHQVQRAAQVARARNALAASNGLEAICLNNSSSSGSSSVAISSHHALQHHRHSSSRHGGHQHRTYVPARLRPVMSEVYVPFGFWRDLFDGSNRKFPSDGVPLKVKVTGAVHLPEQHTLLVRRITPYGYYVLKGIKGLNRLKGKIMVRWNLLMNGVVEMEVGDSQPYPPAAGRLPPNPAAACVTATGAVVPTSFAQRPSAPTGSSPSTPTLVPVLPHTAAPLPPAFTLIDALEC